MRHIKNKRKYLNVNENRNTAQYRKIKRGRRTFSDFQQKSRQKYYV